MKSFLCFLFSFVVLCAAAGVNDAEPVSYQLVSGSQGQEVMMPARKGPVRPPLNARYQRPAGAYFSHLYAKNGKVGFNSVSYEFVQMKPYSNYTFHGIADSIGPETQFIWYLYDEYGSYYPWGRSQDLTVNFDAGVRLMPLFSVSDGSASDTYQWYNPSYGMMQVICPIKMLTAVTPSQLDAQDGMEYLLTSKSPSPHSYNNKSLFMSSEGAQPYGNNDVGWWFGKNGEHIDGMAQAFEKPSHSYLLKKVYLMMDENAVVNDNVTMYCKVYRLDEIPAYSDEGSVTLPETPGELVVSGKGVVSHQSLIENNGCVEFNLFDIKNGHEIEYYPTVDYPILVVIEGYNDQEAANLVDFTAFISTNTYTDEGFGELAYLKCPVNDSGGRFTGEYVWRGLNRFFYSRQMKTGLSIFIVADMPYLLFSRLDEQGEFIFDSDGGEMVRTIGGDTVEGIEFKTCLPPIDGDWSLSCRGEELPDWLNIELVDGEQDGEFNGFVTARVTAAPMPEGGVYREAVVRFEIPGAYQDYVFRQEAKMSPPDTDEPNFSTLNRMISIILGLPIDEADKHRYDLNDDGVINITDVNIMIEWILNIID